MKRKDFFAGIWNRAGIGLPGSQQPTSYVEWLFRLFRNEAKNKIKIIQNQQNKIRETIKMPSVNCLPSKALPTRLQPVHFVSPSRHEE